MTLFNFIPYNKLSLTDLLTVKPTEANYEELVELLTELALSTYEDFKFFIAKSSDETKAAHFMQITSHYDDFAELHKLIFARAIEYGIDMRELQRRFAQAVADDKVIDLGEEVVVIIDDGTPQLATGVSPIQSGFEGSEITFIISFIKEENYDQWAKNNLPQPPQEAPEEPTSASWTQDIYINE
jgi:hypothetical protein